MELDVVVHEGGDEEIGVVVARVVAQSERLADLACERRRARSGYRRERGESS